MHELILRQAVLSFLMHFMPCGFPLDMEVARILEINNATDPMGFCSDISMGASVPAKDEKLSAWNIRPC